MPQEKINYNMLVTHRMVDIEEPNYQVFYHQFFQMSGEDGRSKIQQKKATKIFSANKDESLKLLQNPTVDPHTTLILVSLYTKPEHDFDISISYSIRKWHYLCFYISV